MKRNLFSVLLVLCCVKLFSQNVNSVEETIETDLKITTTNPPVTEKSTPASDRKVSFSSPNAAPSAATGSEGLRSTSEVSAFLGEGLSGLSYNTANGTAVIGTGANFGLGYSYFITNEIGVVSGLGLSFFNSTATLYELCKMEYRTEDQISLGVPAHWSRQSLNNYIEKQNITALNIPIMVHYQSPIKLFARGGIQMSIPISASYTASGGTLWQYHQFNFENQHYPSEYTPWNDGTSDKAIGSSLVDGWKMSSTTSDIDVSFCLMLSIEAGVRLPIVPNHCLYVSGYFDYGLNNAIATANKNFIILPSTYSKDNTSKANFSTNSILNSQVQAYNKDHDFTKTTLPEKSFVSSAHLIDVGLRVRYGFSVSGFVKAASVNDAVRGAGGEPNAMQNMFASLLSKLNKNKTADTKSSPKKKVTKKQRDRFLRTIREPLVGFEILQSTLSPAMKHKLNVKVNALKQMPDVKIILYGYTSDVGDNALAIGLKRAQAVKNYLVQKGVRKNNVSVVSRGAESPLVPNTNSENKKINSRVEFLEK